MESMELPDDIFATDCITEEIVAADDGSMAPEVPVIEAPPTVSRNIIKVVQQQKPHGQITPIKVLGSPMKKPMVVVSAGGMRPTSSPHVRNLNNPIVISAPAVAAAKPLQVTNKTMIRPTGSTLLAQHLTSQSPRPVMIRGTAVQGFNCVNKLIPAEIAVISNSSNKYKQTYSNRNYYLWKYCILEFTNICYYLYKQL